MNMNFLKIDYPDNRVNCSKKEKEDLMTSLNKTDPDHPNITNKQAIEKKLEQWKAWIKLMKIIDHSYHN